MADEEKYPARCIKCKGAFSVTRRHSAFFGTQTNYACKGCNEEERRIRAAEQETEKARLDNEREEAKAKAEIAKARVEEVDRQKEIEQIKLQQLEVEKQKAEVEKQKVELEKQKAEVDGKKAHWEQMRAAIQAKDNTEKLEAQAKLADAQKSRAETAEKVLKEFKELREDGQSVTTRDLNTMLYSFHQTSVGEREHEVRRRPKIWTAPQPQVPMKPLPED